MKYCRTPADMPLDQHYAALVFETITIPGDERSKNHPGHGYPEHQLDGCFYIAFDNKVECTNWAKEKVKSNTKFKIIFVKGCTVETSVEVSIT